MHFAFAKISIVHWLLKLSEILKYGIEVPYIEKV